MRSSYAKKLLIVGVGGVVLGGGAWYLREEYLLPAHDLNAMGVHEVRPWTSRQVGRDVWRDGSAATYAFTISGTAEDRLRKLCKPELNGSGPTSIGTCYIAHEKRQGAPDVSVAVGSRVVYLYYVGG
jgi:hypothetical protein